MKALQLLAPGHVEVREVPVPTIGPAEVLLKVEGAGICHSDLHVIHSPELLFRPGLVLGHEIAGRVDEVGDEVAGWQAGDTAVVYLCWSCGTCAACTAGNENACRVTAGRLGAPPCPGLGPDGGMAEFVAVPARALVPIGDLDPLLAAPLADAAMTPYHAIRLVGDRLAPGATAVVIGVGGLGQLAVQILQAISAARIVAVDLDDGRLALASEHGADVALRSDDPATPARILELTDGYGAEVVLDVVGSDATLALAAATVAPNGAISAIGVAGGTLPFAATPPPALPWGASLRRSYGGTRADLVAVVALARAGRIRPPVERFALGDAVAAIERLDRSEVAGRAVPPPASCKSWGGCSARGGGLPGACG